jgi:hypothetical protein
MSKKPCPPLTVVTEENRSFIHVPSGFAMDLHHFLRSNGVITSPPEPLWTGTDCIQLDKRTPPDDIQKILNRWAA